MNKLATYLQSHIRGEIIDSEAVRDYFSTDASILTIKPNLIVYPQDTTDLRKIARFAWQLAEKGHAIPITARGSGTDQTGAAIGKGLMVVFPAHLDRILELDTRQRLVRIQPGVNFKSLQETMQTHGLFLPPYPASVAYSTIGGAIANNTAGEKSLKYGAMRRWVDRLEVVLANGEVIQTGPISKRELEKKKGLPTMEGEIYRQIDAIIEDNLATIKQYQSELNVSKNSVGYAIGDVKKKDGTFDLTPLFVGSQGTLGIIAEAILQLTPYSPASSLVVAAFESERDLTDAVERLRPLRPSALEMIDDQLVTFIKKHHGTDILAPVFGETSSAKYLLFAEFDEFNEKANVRLAKKAHKLLNELSSNIIEAADFDSVEKLWAIRHSVATVTSYDKGGKAALPVIEDAIVPSDKFEECLIRVRKLFESHHLECAVWGHAGDANIHLQPLLDLKKLQDRQKIFKLMDDYYRMIISMGGSIAAEHNEGRLRAPYVALQVGDAMADVFVQVKQACDPYGILNPGVKTATSLKDLAPMVRTSYSLAHLAEHLPRT